MPEISRLASDVLAQSWKEFVWQWSAIFSQNDEHYFDVKDKSDSRANHQIHKICTEHFDDNDDDRDSRVEHGI